MYLSNERTEKHIQQYCVLVLRSKGESPRTEVFCGNGYYADIVSGNTVYELKKILDYDNLYKAKGQGEMYAQLLGLQRVVLAGYLPESDREREKAQRLADQFRAVGIEVSFLDEDPFWELTEWQGLRLVLPHGWYIRLVGGLVGALLLAWAWGMRGALLDRRDCRIGVWTYECINHDGTTERVMPWRWR